MALTIDDIGISKEEIADRVVESIADRIVTTTSVDNEDGEWRRDSSFFNEMKDSVRKMVAERAKREIDSKLLGVLDEILGGEFQPIDNYGEPNGARTTLREMVKTRTLKFLEEKVNDKGNPVDQWTSSAGTRLDVSMKKAVAEICTATVHNELKAAVDSAKQQIGNLVAKTIVEKLLK